MKTLKTFLEKKPSYLKWGAERLAKVTGISINTVNKFRNSPEFKAMKKNYLTVGQ
jgi:hypothetical protein